MKTLLLIIQFASSILLTVVILVQSSKAEGSTTIGSPARMFKAQPGVDDGLTKFTAILAVIFLMSAGIFGVIY